MQQEKVKANSKALACDLLVNGTRAGLSYAAKVGHAHGVVLWGTRQGQQVPTALPWNITTAQRCQAPLMPLRRGKLQKSNVQSASR